MICQSVYKKVVSVIIVLFTLCLSKVEASILSYSNEFVLQQRNPIPPGGMEKFREWVAKNYVLPNEAKLNKVQGRIILAFIIEKDGSLSNFSIDNDFGYGTGEAAVRLFKNSPKWTAATKNGKAVRTFYKFPIMITLEEDTSESSYPAYGSTSTAPIPPAPKDVRGGVIRAEGKWGEKEVAPMAAKTIGRDEQISSHTIYESVDVLPEPQGGMRTFREWIGSNYTYPQDAIDAGVSGTVMVEFIVEKDGTLTDIKAKSDIGYGTGRAAVNLLKRAKKWSPGMHKGRSVRVKYRLPLKLDMSNF